MTGEDKFVERIDRFLKRFGTISIAAILVLGSVMVIAAAMVAAIVAVDWMAGIAGSHMGVI